MDFLNFLREDPMMAWFVFLALLVTIVPAVSVLGRRMSGHGQAEQQNNLCIKQNRHASETRLN